MILRKLIKNYLYKKDENSIFYLDDRIELIVFLLSEGKLLKKDRKNIPNFDSFISSLIEKEIIKEVNEEYFLINPSEIFKGRCPSCGNPNLKKESLIADSFENPTRYILKFKYCEICKTMIFES
ncbi:hypothetical protein GW932_01445 [archaeon]|nr:hypothetical protein [archaeon]